MDTKFKVGDRVYFVDQESEEYSDFRGKVGTVFGLGFSDGFTIGVEWGEGERSIHPPRFLVLAQHPETTYEPPIRGFAPKFDLKDTNPKDAIGSTKLPLHLVPDSAPAYMALAFCEGATKYGAFNWRVDGVRASIYMAAARRHMAKYWNGEWADSKTKVPHLASAMACMAIILDAKLVDKLTDDRPPAAPMTDLIDGMAEIVQHLQELHKDMHPRHWTIDDSDPLLGVLSEPV